MSYESRVVEEVRYAIYKGKKFTRKYVSYNGEHIFWYNDRDKLITGTPLATVLEALHYQEAEKEVEIVKNM